jgi:hypothetical protein
VQFYYRYEWPTTMAQCRGGRLARNQRSVEQRTIWRKITIWVSIYIQRLCFVIAEGTIQPFLSLSLSTTLIFPLQLVDTLLTWSYTMPLLLLPL